MVYDRRFLRRHMIHRWEFANWCDKAGIPFPEFWFPPGWKTDEPGYPESLRKSVQEVGREDLRGDAERQIGATPSAIPKKAGELAQEFAVQFAREVRGKNPLSKTAEIIRALREDRRFRAFRNPVYSEKHIRTWIDQAEPNQQSAPENRRHDTGKIPASKQPCLIPLERNYLRKNK